MVGVPAFFLWVCGPSVRMVSPIWRALSRSMNHGPMMKDSTSAVIAAARMRVDGYRNTRRKPSSSPSVPNRRWNST